MKIFNESELKKLCKPAQKISGEDNGQITIIGGSKLFHGAPLLSLKVASRIVDMVFFATPEPSVGKVAEQFKSKLFSFIWVPWDEVDSYIQKSDSVLIGPGFMRYKSEVKNSKLKIKNYVDEEGEKTKEITKHFLIKYPNKKWVIDAGALQMMEPEWTPPGAILTPHTRELMTIYLKSGLPKEKSTEEKIRLFSRKYNCLILLKGEKDQVVYKDRMIAIPGGNAGMTKGGTGDVLAGLAAALYCKNDTWISAAAASFINKKAGKELYQKMGYWFNASDLANQIPLTMKRLLVGN